MNFKDIVIGIIGNGVVGRALARAYCEYVSEVRIYDTVEEKRTHTLGETLESNLIFVCLPTPLNIVGSEICLQHLINFFANIPNQYKASNFVIKSTLPIGTTKKFVKLFQLQRVVHCPEFLTARTALHDACNPSRNIIGSPYYTVGRCGHLLSEFLFYRHPSVPTIVCDSNESELIKLAVNGYYAHKITYFNKIREIVKALECNWDVVKSGMLTDGKISEHHTQVPGPDGKYGFGGACLPKDLNALIFSAEEVNVNMEVSKAVYSQNLKDRERSHVE